jgi:hypothetical protein
MILKPAIPDFKYYETVRILNHTDYLRGVAFLPSASYLLRLYVNLKRIFEASFRYALVNMLRVGHPRYYFRYGQDTFPLSTVSRAFGSLTCLIFNA